MNQTRTPRVVTSELLNQLDSVERLLANQYLLEGKWILQGGEK